MNKIYKVAIIGGGASGVFSALLLTSGENALKGEDIVILERNDRICKKLLVTGNGQGNLTNAVISSENYYGEKNFINAFWNAANGFNLNDNLLSLGIPIAFDKTGRGYPISKQANAVCDVFRAHLDKRGINVITNCFVNDISKKDDFYIVTDGKNSVCANYVICAFGGKSGEKFGTDGSSYRLLEKFGHKLTPLYPSLVQIKTPLDKIRSLKGIKEDVIVKAYGDGKLLKTAKGELLFTEYGISGPAVFQISGHLSGVSNPYVVIEFLPDYDEESVAKIVESKISSGGFSEEKDLLNGLVKKRLGQVIFSETGSPCAEKLAHALKNFRLSVVGNTGFNNSQVTKGGVDTEKINPITMESKLSRGTFAIGELLNVDGDCGGYNLTFAFVSAARAAQTIKEKIVTNTK